MHKKSFILCGLTCIAGVFGAFARWIQNTTAFEVDTGLAIKGAPWSTVLTAYLLLIAVAFLFSTRYFTSQKRLSTGAAYPEAFKGGPALCSISGLASAALMCIGGIIQVSAAMSAGKDVFGIIGGSFAIIAGVCAFYLLRNINAKAPKSGGAAFIVIVLFQCFRLISEYKAGASDPVIWHYAIRILAICATILAFYYLAGYCFNKPKQNSTLYFSQMGIFMSIITIADDVSFSYHLITIGMILSMLTLTLLLVGNMTPVWPRPAPIEDEADVQ